MFVTAVKPTEWQTDDKPVESKGISLKQIIICLFTVLPLSPTDGANSTGGSDVGAYSAHSSVPRLVSDPDIERAVTCVLGLM